MDTVSRNEFEVAATQPSGLPKVAVEVELENNLENPVFRPETPKNDDIERDAELMEDYMEGEDVTDEGISEKEDNTFAAKKTAAQGMMDIALLTANANQLRYIIHLKENNSTYYLNLILISISLILQVCVGVSLIFRGRRVFRDLSKDNNENRINNYVLVGVFLITVINVFIASFTIFKDDANSRLI